ncbi:MAG: MATE family efflux transporter [Planctomycetota bacterium]
MQNWWSRPCGGRDVLKIALPLIISTASWSVMNFIDRMFLLWHSTEAMAAAMPAGLLHFSLVCFPLGLAQYTTTFVAQYHGAGRPERVGVALWQGLWVGAIAAPLFLLTIPAAPALFHTAGHDAAVADLETVYFQILAFAGGAGVLAAAMASFFTGRGKTHVVMVVDVTAALMNVGLDYCLIFGNLGFPTWGMAGAAWATVASMWFRVLAYGLLMSRSHLRRRYQLVEGCRYDRELMSRLFKFGAPNGLQLLLEVSAFSVFIVLVGHFGREAMAATTLAFNINSLAWVPMLGLGNAVTAMVGQQLGRNSPRLAARATWTAFLMAQAYLSTMALLYVTVPDAFMLGHASGMERQPFSEIRDTVVVLLRFAAVYSLFDAMNLVFVSAIKGAGDTRFVLATTAVMSPLPVLIGWLGVRVFDGGLLWCWLVITVWISLLGLIYLLRYLQGKWRRMRVIEAEYLAAPPARPTGDLPTSVPPEVF